MIYTVPVVFTQLTKFTNEAEFKNSVKFDNYVYFNKQLTLYADISLSSGDSINIRNGDAIAYLNKNQTFTAPKEFKELNVIDNGGHLYSFTGINNSDILQISRGRYNDIPSFRLMLGNSSYSMGFASNNNEYGFNVYYQNGSAPYFKLIDDGDNFTCYLPYRLSGTLVVSSQVPSYHHFIKLSGPNGFICFQLNSNYSTAVKTAATLSSLIYRKNCVANGIINIGSGSSKQTYRPLYISCQSVGEGNIKIGAYIETQAWYGNSITPTELNYADCNFTLIDDTIIDTH